MAACPVMVDDSSHRCVSVLLIKQVFAPIRLHIQHNQCPCRCLLLLISIVVFSFVSFFVLRFLVFSFLYLIFFSSFSLFLFSN